MVRELLVALTTAEQARDDARKERDALRAVLDEHRIMYDELSLENARLREKKAWTGTS